MSNVDTILDNSTSEAYYDPSMDFSGLMPEGMYKAHATDLVIKENIVIKNKYISDIYEVKFEIAPENEENTYEDNGNEISGKTFVGKEVRSKGFFRFKKPDKTTHPNLEENSGSNKSYMELIQSFGIVSEPDSEGRYFLPNVNESDVVGMPVEIEVKHNEWTNSEGEKVKTPKAVAIFRWEGQAKKDLTEDLPF